MKQLQKLFIHDFIFMISLRNSIFASENLNFLTYINDVVQKKSIVRILIKNEENLYADRALKRASFKSYTLKFKENLSLINEIVISAAADVLIIYDVNIFAILV